jgi:hypothetical protein
MLTVRFLFSNPGKNWYLNFLNNSLKASGGRCIRLEREVKDGHNSFTMIFGDIDLNTIKETRLYIDYDIKNEML